MYRRPMLGRRSFYTIVDNLGRENAGALRCALRCVSDISRVVISVQQGVVEVKATRDVREQVRLACSVAGPCLRAWARRYRSSR